MNRAVFSPHSRVFVLLCVVALTLCLSPRVFANESETVVSVIVIADSAENAAAAAQEVGATITHELNVIDAVAVQLTESQYESLAKHPFVQRLYLDAPVQTNSHLSSLRDNFDNVAYDNSDGTATWTSEWKERNDDDDPGHGDAVIWWGQLHLKNGDVSLRRKVDLADASEATLSFTYYRSSFEDENDYVELQIYGDGEWQTLERFVGPATDMTPQSFSFDLTPFVNDLRKVRFITSSSMSRYDYFIVDNFEILFRSDALDKSGEGQSYRDTFSIAGYGGQDGSDAWSADWVESGDFGQGYFGGIRIRDGQLELSSDNRSIRRIADLSVATTAQLTIWYQHTSLNDETKYVALEVSTNYGEAWQELDRYSGETNDGLSEVTYSLDDFIGNEIMLRFATSDGMDWHDIVSIDEVVIDFSVDDKTHSAETNPLDTPVASWIKADQLHEAGITGDNVTVGVIDTGFYAHPNLLTDQAGAERVLAQYDAIRDVITKRIGDVDVVEDDAHGHGAHVTSIIANSAEAESGISLGIAPDVDLVLVKAFSADGSGTYADVIRGIDKLIQYKDALDLRILNLSFYSTPQSHYWEDPLNLAVMRAWEAGIVIVTGAGNAGPDPLSIGVPGNVPYVITVGAITDNYTANSEDDYIPPFSSAGPSFEGFIKPEIVAPGAHIPGLLSQLSTIGSSFEQFAIDDEYFALSGTSMSAAVTSGVVALMLQQDPDLTPTDVKCRLIDSASVALDVDGNLAFSIFQQGAGLVNAYAAVYSSAGGCANGRLDISADIAGEKHYVGPTTLSEDGDFVILDQDGVENLHWNGTYSNLSGNYLWSGGNYLWSGGNYLWSGGNYLWSGGNYLWSGGNYLWSGGNYLWSGGNYLWSGSDTNTPFSSSYALGMMK